MAQRSLRARVLVPVLSLTGLSIAASAVTIAFLQSHTIAQSIDRETAMQSQAVVDTLAATDQLMHERVQSSMRLLIARGTALGSPAAGAVAAVGGSAVPDLLLGTHAQANDFKLVDGVVEIMGGTATLFTRSGDDFVRVATNVKKDDGSRAVGTKLDPQGKAIAQLRQGKAFYGQVDILGNPFLTGYEPIRDASGGIVGAWYVGYKADLGAIGESIAGSNVLGHGIAALVDDRGRVRFHSRHASDEDAAAMLAHADEDWIVSRRDFAPWGYRVHTAFPRKVARDIQLRAVAGVAAAGAALATLLAGLLYVLLNRLVLRPIGGEPEQAMAVARDIAGGNLGQRLPAAPADSVLGAIAEMQRGLQRIVGEINALARRVADDAARLATTSGSVSERVARQNDLVTTVAATLEQITHSVGMVADNADIARCKAAEAGSQSIESAALVGRTVEAMQGSAESVHRSADTIVELSESSQEISRIVGVIKEIADQTNMLALNAAIEAARAGEQGRGFAVVADEVRKLAERTALSTGEIARMIGEIQARTRRATEEMASGNSRVNDSVALAATAGQSMNEVRDTTGAVLTAVSEISGALGEQRNATGQIARDVTDIAHMNADNTAALRELAAATHDVQKLAADLRSAAAAFRT